MLWRFLGFLAMLRGAPRHDSQWDDKGENNQVQKGRALHAPQ